MSKRDRSSRGEGEVREIRVARRVYVGNLSYRTSWQDLKDFFGAVGAVRHADVLREPGPDGRSKGCGIVEFETPDDAAAAILELNDAELDGRKIFIREDREDFELKGDAHRGSYDRRYDRSYDRGPPRRARRSSGGGGGPPGEGEVREIRVARRVYVGNLSYRTSWQDLKDFFGAVGAVRHADVLREPGPDGRSKGCGIVEFETPDDAAAAILELNDAELDGRKIFIREDREDYELRGDGHYGGSERSLERGPAKRPYRGSGSRDGGATIGRRVFVSNLAYSTTWQELKDHFKQAGHVLHADILQDAEGNSKGSGTVEFERARDALHAISLLSNSTLCDRHIHVREDREDPGVSLGGGGGGPPGRPISHAAPGTQIVVHGLPYKTSWQDLKDMCRPAGAVVHADIVMGSDGRSKGWGTVAFATPSDAEAAIQLLNGTELEGRIVSAKLDKYV